MRRYANFSSNLNALQKAYGEDLSNDFIVGGIIDKFALQFELSWKLLKEALSYEGVAEAVSGSPRDILKAAYATYDFIEDGIWLDMLQARNTVMHLYDEGAALRLANKVLEEYIPAFTRLDQDLQSRYGRELLASS